MERPAVLLVRFTPVRTGRRRPVLPGGRCGHGSPPYARGGDEDRGFHAGRDRFTPVRTGRRTTTSMRRAWRSVHPRTHGEDAFTGTRTTR